MNRTRLLTFVLLLLMIAAPAWSYVIILKDGNQIIAREKYRLEDDKAYLTLESGTQTFIDASEIDFKKTEEANQNLGVGGVRVLEGTTQIDEPPPPPPPEPTLSSLTTRSSLALPEVSEKVDPEIPRTPAGFIDLSGIPRRAPQNVELNNEVTRFLLGQGIDDFKLYQGTTNDRLLLEVVVTTEAAVFKVLRDTSGLLQQIRARSPEQLSAFEIFLETDRDSRAGQFLLTSELAEPLVNGQIDAPVFFYRYVQF